NRLGDINDLANEMNVKLEQNLTNVKSSKIESLLNRPGEAPYWKYQAKGECQELMFTTKLDKVQEFYDMFQQVANDVEFPSDQIGTYVQPMVQGTNTHVGFDLYFSLGDENSVETVYSLLAKGQKKLLDEGACLYEHSDPGEVDAMKRVKAIFDPNNTLNPGTILY
ncbi:MAG: hypothetical protein KAU48_05935, partial [Candidatus Thorarchaeota archaeon]|nr:hypothetical protein [Candidatus Thorarchaeota archaeon]